jgi:SOS-response transcriptional repressor LexA
MSDNRKKGTRRREAILEMVRSYQEEHGYAPSIREIGESVGLDSSSSVWSHLRTLELSGHLRRERSVPRGLELVDSPVSAARREAEMLLGQQNQLLGLLWEWVRAIPDHPLAARTEAVIGGLS